VARRLTIRIAGLLPLFLVLTALLFALTRFGGGDPARQQLGLRASAEEVAQLREELGLERPLAIQYLDYLGDLARGDLGVSWTNQRPVREILGDRMAVTLWLVLTGVVASLLISVPLAIGSAWWRDGWFNRAVRAFTVVQVVMPTFWVGVLLILVFSVWLGWFPTGGLQGSFGQRARCLVLPALALGLSSAPSQIRTLRAGLIGALDAEYIDAARARGVSDRRVVLRHALPNALVPMVTFVVYQTGYLLFGVVVLENTFRIPGIGRTIIDAVGRRDYPVITGVTLVLSTGIVLLNVAADAVTRRLNPKARTA